MRTHEVVLAEPEEDIGLADAAIPNDQQLGEVIVTVLAHRINNFK
jgi:hypothetical protein